MKGLYIVRFFFRNGTSSERMQIRAWTPAEADRIARTLFNEKFTKSDIHERGGVGHVDIKQCDINSEEVRKYL